MKRTPKQIAALTGVILLASLSVITLIVAVFVPENPRLLAACISAMIGVPILLWLLLYVAEKIKEAKESGTSL
ncbi:MAG: hypothetical protein FWC09_02510 [Lachnospiraceae bacterium]|nr:hypothetical protein [Lachnospiraceae bacterium]